MASDHLVHFVRHGQFAPDTPDAAPVDGSLTAVGRRQARRTAVRLREYTIGRIYSSDLRRARETARRIAQPLGVSVPALPMLRETMPTRVPGHRVPLQERRAGKGRIDAAIARFLVRPPRSGDTVVVCHGNFIRALVCRTLETPPTKWQQPVICHCGITTFRFGEAGQARLQCFNDTGHLPSELRTFL